MRTIVAFGLALSLLCAAPLHAEGASEVQIGQWIEQLGEEDLAVRDKAIAKLDAEGERALPALEKAASEHDAADVRERAGNLVRAFKSEEERESRERPRAFAVRLAVKKCATEKGHSASALMADLRNEDSKVARPAAKIILELGETCPEIFDLVRSLKPDGPVRNYLIKGRCEIGDSASENLEDRKVQRTFLKLFESGQALADRVDEWIGQLGSDNFETREIAQQYLRAAGSAANHALRAAAEGNSDIEIQARAKELLEARKAAMQNRNQP